MAGATTWHLTDKNRPYAQVLTETDAATGALRVRYTYGDDLISQTRPDPADPHANPPATRYYLYDGQMSTRQLTDAAPGAATAVTDTYTYDAYGNLLAETGETLNAYRYTGEQFDAAIGQYYLRARYYDQAAGRFSSRDSFGGRSYDPISLHRYAYAYLNPANLCDPSGRDVNWNLVGLLLIVALFAFLGNLVQSWYKTSQSKSAGRTVTLRFHIATYGRPSTWNSDEIRDVVTEIMKPCLAKLSDGQSVEIVFVDGAGPPSDLGWKKLMDFERNGTVGLSFAMGKALAAELPIRLLEMGHRMCTLHGQ